MNFGENVQETLHLFRRAAAEEQAGEWLKALSLLKAADTYMSYLYSHLVKQLTQ